MKESLCYVSQNFLPELQFAKTLTKQGRNSTQAGAMDHVGGKLKKQFVLPDYSNVMKGYVKPDDELPDAKEQVRECLITCPLHFLFIICMSCCKLR